MTTSTLRPELGARQHDRIVRAPDWLLVELGLSQRQWRAKKRREMREAIKALEIFLKGAAYTPSAGEDACIGVVLKSCEIMLAAMSVRNWDGRRSNEKLSGK